MQRRCNVCGTVYEAQRSTSKYCSSRCRVRKAEGAESTVYPPVVVPDSPSPLVAAIVRELTAVGQLDTVLGQQAVRLAEKMGSTVDTGSATAAASRELRAVMAEAVQGGAAATDPMDELASRRSRKAAGA